MGPPVFYLFETSVRARFNVQGPIYASPGRFETQSALRDWIGQRFNDPEIPLVLVSDQPETLDGIIFKKHRIQRLTLGNLYALLSGKEKIGAIWVHSPTESLNRLVPFARQHNIPLILELSGRSLSDLKIENIKFFDIVTTHHFVPDQEVPAGFIAFVKDNGNALPSDHLGYKDKQNVSAHSLWMMANSLTTPLEEKFSLLKTLLQQWQEHYGILGEIQIVTSNIVGECILFLVQGDLITELCHMSYYIREHSNGVFRLSIRDQRTAVEFHRKRLMTLLHLYLIYQNRITDIVYLDTTTSAAKLFMKKMVQLQVFSSISSSGRPLTVHAHVNREMVSTYIQDIETIFSSKSPPFIKIEMSI